MKYLSIDYGLAHIGLAISEGILAEPFGQLDYISDEKLVADIRNICHQEEISIIIVGISEGQMAKITKQFAQKLEQNIGLTVELIDETLSSQEATRLMVEASIKQSKRRTNGHQTAAAIILQSYLDSK
ncbi:Holliday junction resolvase RuvX [Candidatus Beckwithbacteria bacterium CG23_combo_of_CG06-09_8_20_14_all_34_8]|uniref:Putative pre-16S rRNA nuclease n=1 Tax=Candidatus Beckwithbacteria bacterium CG23_combo_of_CG06-09_8_20_14_all_34_8 TaxID=1974497 RepID=A0A2H0B564_9BACT|nr:MAG: Holliday junction resolvase RuvX [Candidatus Beckwithbacteria bacterium CG23_combo_of_CG06-09_8_20_14_all_34_8]